MATVTKRDAPTVTDTDRSPVLLHMPNALKTFLQKESKRECRSLNKQVIFILSEFRKGKERE